MSESDPPGSVSNQNQEEAEGPVGGSQPDAKDKGDRTERGSRHEDDSPGASSEGSQATGHPDNAG